MLRAALLQSGHVKVPNPPGITPVADVEAEVPRQELRATFVLAAVLVHERLMLLPLALLDSGGRAARIEAANGAGADADETDGAEVRRAHAANRLRRDGRGVALRVKRSEREVASGVEDVEARLLVVRLDDGAADGEAALLLMGEEAVVAANVLGKTAVNHFAGLLLVHRLDLVECRVSEERVLVRGLVPLALGHLDDCVHVRRGVADARDATLAWLDAFAVASELRLRESNTIGRDVRGAVIRLDDGQILQQRIRLIDEVHHVAVELLTRLVHSGGNIPQRKSTLVDYHRFTFLLFVLPPEKERSNGVPLFRALPCIISRDGLTMQYPSGKFFRFSFRSNARRSRTARWNPDLGRSRTCRRPCCVRPS